MSTFEGFSSSTWNWKWQTEEQEQLHNQKYGWPGNQEQVDKYKEFFEFYKSYEEVQKPAQIDPKVALTEMISKTVIDGIPGVDRVFVRLCTDKHWECIADMKDGSLEYVIGSKREILFHKCILGSRLADSLEEDFKHDLTERK